MIDTEEYYGGTYPSPNWEDEKYQGVKIVCTVETYVKVPEEFELRSSVKDWIEENYKKYILNAPEDYIFSDINTEVYIDEVELLEKEW